MSQLKRIAWPRFLLLLLTLFALSVIWPATGSAALWDDLLKKAEDLASDVVKDVLDDDDEEESDDDQEAAQETSPADTAPDTETPSVAGQPTQPEIAQELPTPNCEKPSTSSEKVCCARHELCEEFGFKRPKQGAPVVNTRPTTPPPTPTPTAPPADPTALAGTGTVTIDGETQSFTVKQCDRYIHRSTEIVDIWSPDATVYFKFQETRFPPGSRASAEQKLRLSLLGYSYPLDTIRRKLTSGVWEDTWSRPTPGPLYHIDGLTLTAGATFNNPVTGKDTVMEFSVNCAEWHCPGGRFGCEYIEYTDRVAPAAETPEPTQEPDKGTMTVDGETRSFVVKKCSLIPLDGGNYKIQGYARGDAGAMLRFNLAMGHGSISVQEGGQDPKYVAPRDATAAVYRVDGSTVTVDGIFDYKRGGTKHSIQMSFDCSS